MTQPFYNVFLFIYLDSLQRIEVWNLRGFRKLHLCGLPRCFRIFRKWRGSVCVLGRRLRETRWVLRSPKRDGSRWVPGTFFFYPRLIRVFSGYPEFGFHLNRTGRPMIYSCSWPVYQIYAGMQVIQSNFDAVF